MATLKIILSTIAAAIAYGIAQDMITAHLCVEYFTIGHPKVIESEQPIHLAFVWGVLATWWVGLIGGVLLAWAARSGPWPKRSARDLVRPIGTCLVAMGVSALIAGLAGHFAASKGWVVLTGVYETSVPADRHVAFLTNLWAHSAAYLFGALAILLLAWRTRRRRKKEAEANPSAV